MAYRDPRFLKLHSAFVFVRGGFFLILGHLPPRAQSPRLGHLNKTPLKNTKDAVVFVLWLGIFSLRRLAIFFWHKFPLFLVFFYFFVFFNPFSKGSGNQGPEVWCPNGYAYKTKLGRYIKCEDFDEYHADLYDNQKERPDLYIDAAGPAK